MPELLPAAAPEMSFVALERKLERLFIHVRHGQYFTGVGVLNDGRNQTVGAELCIVQYIIHRTTTPFSRK
jgi:hypothetical protein